ncbi:MAG TPA: hypothetical protein VJ917_00190 [Saprospiraceae bacterium]|nr:hypothetical protein [Saprospiraceae bacterium]
MPFRLLLWICCCLIASKTSAQFGTPSPAGARGIALGDMRTIIEGPEAVFSNPALLGLAEQSSISAFTDHRFLVQDLYGAYAGGILHRSSGSFGVDAYHYGWGDYNENSIGIQYGRKLAENLSLGLKLKAFHFNVTDYGQRTVIGADLAAVHQVTRKFSAGVVISNPVPVEIAEGQDTPSAIHVGFKYRFSKKLFSALELSKVEKQDMIAKAGIHYSPSTKIDLMFGYQSLENQISFGSALKMGLIDINFSATLHPLLGTSLAGGINYRFKRNS